MQYEGFSLMCAWSHNGALIITQSDYDDAETAKAAFRAAIANDVVAASVHDESDRTVVEYPRG